MGDRGEARECGPGSSRAWPPMCSTLFTTFRATATLDFMPGTTSSTACGDGGCGGRGGQDPDSKIFLMSVFAAGHARSHAKQTMPTVTVPTAVCTCRLQDAGLRPHGANSDCKSRARHSLSK